MHFCTFVIIGRHEDPEIAVARALAPFDESLVLEPYRDYVAPSEIGRLANYYGTPPTELHALAAKMEDWRGCEGGVDPHGLYAVSTYNPDGKWDWYEIGGRWDRYVARSRGNVISSRALRRSRHLRKCLPYYLVTPDGRWLEREDAPCFGPAATASDRRAKRRWLAQVRRVLSHYIDHSVVCVDVHS